MSARDDALKDIERAQKRIKFIDQMGPDNFPDGTVITWTSGGWVRTNSHRAAIKTLGGWMITDFEAHNHEAVDWDTLVTYWLFNSLTGIYLNNPGDRTWLADGPHMEEQQ